MPNVRAFRAGNWSDTSVATSPWSNGTAVFAPASNDDVWLNNFAVTLDTPATVNTITNGSVGSQSWKDGGTAAATAGGTLTISNAANSLTAIGANGIYSPTTATLISITATSGTVTISAPTIRQTGSLTSFPVISNTNAATVSISGSTLSSNAGYCLVNSSTGGYALSSCTLNAVTGRDQSDLIIISSGTATFSSCTFNAGYTNSPVIRNNGGSVSITTSTIVGSSVAAGVAGAAIMNSAVLSITNSTITAGNFAAITQTTATTLSATGCTFTASALANAVTVSSGTASVTLSGDFISSINGFSAVYVVKFILGTAPVNARTRYALNGSGTYVDMFTADNSTALNQALPTDVRSGVAYGIGNSQTGRLTVPARGSVSLNVNYGPSMPFTATRSGTNATATLAYSYPLVVGDPITVTGSSNSEWNSTYTIASVVSGTSVTFVVPATHSATAGTGALMQTTGTAVLDPAAVASAVWGAASRTITGGLVDTATTLTNAPTVPSVVQIRQEMDANSVKLANLDASVSSRSTLTAAQVNAEADTALADVGLTNTVTGRIDAAISSRLAPNGTLATVTTLTNAPTSVTPSDIWSHASRTITGGTVNTLTNAPSVPSAASIRAEIDSNSTQLAAIKSKTDNLPASPAATGDIPSANITAIKAKTDLLETTRLAQCSTVATTGAQLAAALS